MRIFFLLIAFISSAAWGVQGVAPVSSVPYNAILAITPATPSQNMYGWTASSCSAACNRWLTAANPNDGTHQYSCDGGGVTMTYTPDGSTYVMGRCSASDPYLCPNGGTLNSANNTCVTPSCPNGGTLDSSGNVCLSTSSCPSGTTLNSQDGLCYQSCNQNPGTSYSAQNGGFPYASVPPGTNVPALAAANGTACFQGCQYQVTGGFSTSNIASVTLGLSNGQQCDGSTTAGSAPTTDQAAQDACVAQGLSFITFQGATKCVSASNAASAVAVTTGGTTSNSNTSNNASGVPQTTTTTSNSTTTCNGSTCTTTTTGGDGGSSSVTQPQTAYCDTHPEELQCKKPTCDALADPVSCLGAVPPQEPINVIAATLYDPTTSTISFAQNNSCPAPVPLSFSISGKSFNSPISYQPFCDFTAYIRPIILACAALAAGIIFAAGLNL